MLTQDYSLWVPKVLTKFKILNKRRRKFKYHLKEKDTIDNKSDRLYIACANDQTTRR